MYSKDLKEKMLSISKSGKYLQKEVCEMFNVSRSLLYKLNKEESIEAKTYKCGSKKKLSEEDVNYLLEEIEKDSSITLENLSIKLEEERSRKVSIMTIHRALEREKVTYKKKCYIIEKKMKRK